MSVFSPGAAPKADSLRLGALSVFVALLLALGCGASDSASGGVGGAMMSGGSAGSSATTAGAAGLSLSGGAGVAGGTSGGAGGAAGAGGGAGVGTSGGGAGGVAGTSGAAGAGGSPALPVLVSYTGSAAKKGANPGAVNIGQEFTVLKAGVRIQALGVWDEGANGLAAAHTVTLFALDQLGLNPGTAAKPVAGGTVTVPAGSAAALEQGFRFAALEKEIALPPGNYAVVAYGLSDAGDAYGDGGNVPYSGSGVADGGFSAFQFANTPSPSFPNGGDRSSHTSASFRFTSLEPPFIRIMPLGASITDGAHGTNAGYRGFLHPLLDEAHIPAQFVGSLTDNFGSLPIEQRHHEGHSGYTIQGVQDNVEFWLGARGSPADLVLLLLGTNDIVFDSDADFATAGTRLGKLLATIGDKQTGLLPKARVIVAQLPPLKPANWAARDLKYNQMVAKAVADRAKLGQNVELVDMYSALTLDDLYSDGEHPVDSGYVKIAHAWLTAIVKP